jgi:hypothetical protein
MNIYVVSSCWWRDGATVIGAAVERADAERIAERAETDDHRLASWAPWKEEVSPSEGFCTWHRDALMADGTTHASLYQEIVCVPLASGHPIIVMDDREVALTWNGRTGGRSEIEEIGRQFGAP